MAIESYDGDGMRESFVPGVQHKKTLVSCAHIPGYSQPAPRAQKALRIHVRVAAAGAIDTISSWAQEP